MSGEPIRSVLIVGGGSAGWMAAAALASAFRGRLDISVLDLADAADGGVLTAADATLPALSAFHGLIGLDEDALVRRAGATFTLGTQYAGVLGDGSAWLHPYSDYGATLDGVAFHQLWLRAREEGAGASLESYALGAVAAGLGRFTRPDGDPRSVQSTMSYGLHLDIAAYAVELRALATARGARRSEGALAGVERRADGGIEAVVLADGRRLSADLYLDATGQAARLAGPGEIEDWSAWLPCDRVAGRFAPAAAAPAPLTAASALPFGWRLEVPLQRRTYHAVVYPHARQAEALAALGGGGEARIAAFTPGLRTRPWTGNCIALGLAAGVVEPLDGVSLHVAQSGIAKLIGLFPDRGFAGGESTEYNRLMNTELARLRDFAIARYRLNARQGEALWDAARTVEPPPELAHKLRLFESRGRVVLNDEETFLEPSWIALFLGQGLTPRRHHPMADDLPLPALEARLAQVQTVMRRAAEAMPTHGQALARLGASE